MDPKQTEGQNSGSGTLSTGANISRTMDALNVNERKSATSNSPFAKHHFDKVAPGTGDILIDPSAGSIISSAPAENKGINRGRLIQFGLIFGGIALIGLVIFTVVMVINNQPKKSNNSQSTATIGYQEAFNRYANWMVNGTDSTSEIIIPNDQSEYAARKAISSNENLTDFIETAEKYFSDFSKSFFGSELASYNNLTSTVSANASDLEFYLNFLLTSNLSEQKLLSLYLESDSTFKAQLEGIYKGLAELGEPAEDYAELGQSFASQKQAWFDALKKGNCISSNTINEGCSNKLYVDSSDFRSVSAELAVTKSEMDEFVQTIINKIMLNLKVINSELKKPTPNIEIKEEDVEE